MCAPFTESLVVLALWVRWLYLMTVNNAPIADIKGMHNEEEDDSFENIFACIPKHKDHKEQLRRYKHEDGLCRNAKNYQPYYDDDDCQDHTDNGV